MSRLILAGVLSLTITTLPALAVKPEGSGGAGGIPPITSFPGQGADASGSAIGNSIGTILETDLTNRANEDSGSTCRTIITQDGGQITEC